MAGNRTCWTLVSDGQCLEQLFMRVGTKLKLDTPVMVRLAKSPDGIRVDFAEARHRLNPQHYSRINTIVVPISNDGLGEHLHALSSLVLSGAAPREMVLFNYKGDPHYVVYERVDSCSNI